MRRIAASMPCPLCNQDAPRELRTKDFNRGLSCDTFDYYLCPACGLLFLAPIPTNLGDYYPQDYYAIPRSLQRLDQIAQRQRYQIELVQRFVRAGRLLEIGPAYGVFAHLAKQAGFDVEAIEMDERCCRYLSDVVGVRVINSDDPAEVLQRVEPQWVIALWHVIEHLPDPWLCLQRAADRLEPGGILLIAAPNPQALQFRLLRSRWAHLDAPRHLQLIPAELLERQLATLGLAPILVTSSDKGGRGWNVFGWQKTLMNLSSRRSIQLASWGAGWLIGHLANIVESRDLRGCTYTIVFRKVNNP